MRSEDTARIGRTTPSLERRHSPMYTHPRQTSPPQQQQTQDVRMTRRETVPYMHAYNHYNTPRQSLNEAENWWGTSKECWAVQYGKCQSQEPPALSMESCIHNHPFKPSPSYPPVHTPRPDKGNLLRRSRYFGEASVAKGRSHTRAESHTCRSATHDTVEKHPLHVQHQ